MTTHTFYVFFLPNAVVPYSKKLLYHASVLLNNTILLFGKVIYMTAVIMQPGSAVA